MMFLYPLLAVSAFMVMSAAQVSSDPLCDPETQYPKDGTCCTMCPPGKRMSNSAPIMCLTPVCVDCNKDEYQDKYNKDIECKWQPYCDPNKNFESPVHDTKAKTTCKCKEGFHCSSEQCITCAPHSTCDPGYEVLSKGNQNHDTVCRQCQNGTFSSSISGTCEKWTKCETGFYASQSGTRTSDTVCASRHRDHIIVGVVAVAALIILGVACYLYRGHLRRNKQKIAITVASADEEEGRLHVAQEVDESMTSIDHETTENGRCVAQEYGKPDRLPRQESQQPSSSTQLVSL